jgi:tetratricopeptide (TPR) repeat protein
MRPFVSLLLLASVNAGLCAQPAEKIHDLGKDGLKLEGRVDVGDPKVKVEIEGGKTRELPAKSFLIRLPGGKSYRITIRSKEFDSFLVVQETGGKQLDYDDDSGGGLDAALTLDVVKDVTLRVHAAALEKSGAFTLEVRQKTASDPAPLSQAYRRLLQQAALLNAQVFQLYGRGEIKQALEPARQALAIRKKVLGEQHPDTALSLNNLGTLLRAQGDYVAARPYYEQALAIRRKVLGEQHADTAHSLNSLGVLIQDQGDYAAARPYYEQALAVRKKLLGEQHPDTARSLNSLGFLLSAQGDYAAARPYYEQALAIRKKVLGEQNRDTATSLSNLGVLLQEQGDYAAARPYFEQAVAIYKSVLGEQHPDTAHSLNNLGVLLQEQGDYAAARPYLEQALAIRKKFLGEQHRDTAASLNNLGLLLKDQGDYAAARPYLEQALTIRKKVLGEQHPATARSLNSLGFLLSAQGDYAAARPYYEQALAIRKKVLGEQHRDTAASLNNLGALLRAQGEYAWARPYHEQALTIRMKVLGERHPDTALSLNNFGLLLQAQGDYASARPYYEQALAIYKKVLGEQHPDTARSLNNVGSLLQAQGDYASARPYYEQALAIRTKVLGEQDPDTALSLSNLGTLLKAQGDYASARPYYEQALAIRKKVLGEQHPDTARSLNNVGTLLQVQGDYASARPYYEQALAIRKKVLGEQHPDTALSLSNLGTLLQAQGDASARTYYEQALAIYKKVLGEQHPDTARALSNLGTLLRTQGDYASARPFLEKSFAIQRGSLDLAATALSERQQLAMDQSVRFYLDSLLSLLDNPSAGADAAARAHDAVLGWKGATSLRQHQLRLLRRDPGLAPKVDELQTVTARLANLTNAVPDPKKADDRRTLLVKLTQDREKLEVELARLSADFRAEQDQALSTAKALATTASPDTVLVDFLEYWHSQPDSKRKGKLSFERRLTAFVLRSGTPVVRIEFGPTKAISDSVDLWRQAAVRKQALVASEQGRKLRQLLWAPLEKHLGGAKTVLIAPDGATAQVPFAAIPGREPGTYLLEEVAIASFPYPRRLSSLLGARSADGPESLLLVGDIDYGAVPGKSEQVAAMTAPRSGERGFNFRPLENTRGEILALRDTFERRFKKGKTTLLRDDEATEAALRKEAPNHRWLHIATHGFFAPPQIKSAAAPVERNDDTDLFGKAGVIGFHPGLLSGIALAGANRSPEPGQDDGILTAMEVEELDLRKTQLVVLSACETGLGKVAGGEGVLGLQRAFQIAGARTTLTSLWKVDDAATRRLMERFYENYWKRNMGALESLRAAQLAMLRGEIPRAAERDDEPTDRRAPPYYWAGFVLSGDWR